MILHILTHRPRILSKLRRIVTDKFCHFGGQKCDLFIYVFLQVRQPLQHFGGQNGTIGENSFLLAGFSSSAVARPCLSSSTDLLGHFPTSMGETLYISTFALVNDFL